MTQVTREVVDGKARIHGRSLAEWVPEIVHTLAERFDPVRIVLFGSVARGDDDEGSDIDLLVVLDSIASDERWRWLAAARGAVTHEVPVEMLVTDLAELGERGDLPGIFRVAQREGRVVYERAA